MIKLSTSAVRETQTRHHVLFVFVPFRRRALFTVTWSRYDASIQSL
jgi:hypothetical protein